MGDRTIIVNADDFGISEEVNTAIAEAHRAGVVTSATLLVNGPAVEHAVDLATALPELGIGVHLNTSEFAAMSPEFSALRARRPSLDLRIERSITAAMRRAVGAEWRAQISAARRLGIAPTHLDSHHFDHVNPMLLPTLISVARSSEIRRVRGMHNLWVDPPNGLVRGVKRIHRSTLRGFGLLTTDHMCDVDSYLRLVSEDRAPRIGSVELMAHPGHPSYEAETQRLLSTGSIMLGGSAGSWLDIG